MPQTSVAMLQAAAPVRSRAKFYPFLGLIVLLLLLLPLRCIHLTDPAAEYARARQLFESGYLANGQQEAARGYSRFLSTRPEWASQFLLLEAESMIWRGMNESALHLLSTQPLAFFQPAMLVQKLSLEAVAYTRLQKFSEAANLLADSERICAANAYATCGGAIRAEGIIALEQGRFAQAKDYFVKSLSFARLHNERLLETTVLLYIGVVSLQSERFDEALDWSRSAYRKAADWGEEDLLQVASGNMGWAYFKLGDRERALELLVDAEKRAAKLDDTLFQIKWLTTTAYVYMDLGRIEPAKEAYRRALISARQINSKEDIAGILIDLGQVALRAGNPDEADAYAGQAMKLAKESGNGGDRADAIAIQLQAAALRGDRARAEGLLHDVETSPDSQTAMKWASQHALARLYEDHGDTPAALNAYHAALVTFENARDEIHNEDSQLPFLANATRIYDDYIHFLVKQGMTEEALAAADQSRARTLAQGLGVTTGKSAFRPAELRTGEIAQKTGATVLFYWLGEKQSYLWAITPKKTTLFTLPAQGEIAPAIERYRKELLEPALGGDAFSEDGAALYRTLIAPAVDLIRANANVVVVNDGPLSLLNFETLVVPGASPHYWIEDANVVSAPSLYLLASAKPARSNNRKLLLLGDAVSPNPDYPDLPMAAVEMRQIEKHFGTDQQTVFRRQSASSDAYLKSPLTSYSFIHFVAHGIASRTDPLDSAIILSRTSAAEDSFKLHAREIIQHPIDARLVTISACYGGGTRSYAGEGLVGLSWAFLRAGAHNVIGALWEASDDSTPQLMDGLYQGLEDGKSPSAALRQAKLALLHSQEKFSQPFYWAPFQIYTGL
jgi:CHAT domain-containing protein/Tfp pilus assembly protein PilF